MLKYWSRRSDNADYKLREIINKYRLKVCTNTLLNPIVDCLITVPAAITVATLAIIPVAVLIVVAVAVAVVEEGVPPFLPRLLPPLLQLSNPAHIRNG